MKTSRTALVAMLVAVELLIAGFGIWTFRNGSIPAFASTMHHVAADPKPVATLALGPAPHVVVEDPDSRVIVKVSSDGLVHVSDLTSADAYSSGTIPPLQVTRTPDGAHIERAAAHTGFSFSFTFGDAVRETQIDLPAGSHVEIQKSSGSTITGLHADLLVRSQDGRIYLDSHEGNVDAHSDDGSIIVTNARGGELKFTTADGRVEMHDVSAESLDANSADGRIEATNLTITGAQPRATFNTQDGNVRVGGTFAPGGTYQITTSDGRVELGLAPGADLAVDASTGDGSIVVDGTKYGGDGSVQHSIRLGSGAGSLHVSSGDGSIHITTNGAF